MTFSNNTHNIIKHEKFDQIQREIAIFISTASPGDMLFIEGPYAVGKKTAVNQIAGCFAEAALDQDPDNNQIMPVVSFFAPSISDTKVYLRSFLNTWTQQLIPQSASNVLKLALSDREITDVSQADDRREARIKALMQGRKTGILIIHNAERIQAYNESRSKSKVCLFDVIHAISQDVGCIVIFTGCFGSLDNDNATSNVIAASRVVDFPAYNFRYEEEFKSWKKLVDEVKKELPSAYHPSLKKMEGNLTVGSLGCVGLLKQWFQRASKLKSSPNFSSVPFGECVLLTANNNEKLDLLSNELYRSTFQELESDKEIRRAIGLVKPQKSRKKNSRPFKRNPCSDHVPPREEQM